MLTRLAPPTYQRDVRPMPGTPINWDSRQARGLVYCWPLWEGGGMLANELVHGAHAVTNDVADPPLWKHSDIGAGILRGASDTDSLVAFTRLVPLPMTFTAVIRTTIGATQSPIFGHNAASASSGYRLSINNTTGLLRFTLVAVANYDATTCVIPPGQLCYVAVSATGNVGTVRFAVHNAATGRLTSDGPTTIGTLDIGPVPDQFELCLANGLADSGDAMYMADARVYNVAMGQSELADLVNPASRWDLYSTGTFTRGSGLATLMLDAPPLTFLELAPFNQSPQVQLVDPGLSILELETFDVQETQSGFTTLGAVATPGATRGAVSG